MHSTKRLWTPEARARKPLKLGPNTILAIMRHGCSILTATISRSFIRAKLIFILLIGASRVSNSGRGSPVEPVKNRSSLFLFRWINEHEAAQIERANRMGRQPVVFVHGLWLLPSTWERWATVFEEAG